MKKLVFACALLCSFDLNMVSGMNPNQLLQTENIADQNNQIGEIGLNIEETNDVVIDDTEENPQRRKVAILCGLTSAFFSGTSLLLATATSFGVYQHKVNPADNLKKMAKTIAAFVGVGSGVEALLSHIPTTRFHCIGFGINSLLSLAVPAMEIASIHRGNSVVRSPVENLELFLVDWITYSFATLGGISLFDSLRLFWRR